MAYDNTNKQPANWVKKITLSPTLEIGISDKGFVGIWVKGRWQAGLQADDLAILLEKASDVAPICAMAHDLREKHAVNKIDNKLAKEAAAYAAKAAKYAQAAKEAQEMLEKLNTKKVG